MLLTIYTVVYYPPNGTRGGYLAKLGALPRIVVIDSTQDRKIGPDDFVLKHGIEALKNLPTLELRCGPARIFSLLEVARPGCEVILPISPPRQ